MFKTHPIRLKHAVTALIGIVLLAGCLSSDDSGGDSTAQNSTPVTVTPAERPEDVECLGSSVRKQAFFGDLHIHTYP